jgi:two-component system sensor histidine kinase YesM
MIKWYIRLGQKEKATHILVQFAKLLRQGIDNKDEMVTVRDEIAVIGIYLDIQKHRFEDKLTTEIDIQPGILEYKIPKYIIQPIVENSIVHGLKNKIDPGHIRVEGYENDGNLVFIISDNGTGISQAELDRIPGEESSGDDRKSGTGIRNVMKRIKLYYGNEYGLSIESLPDIETKIILRMHRNPVV